MQTVKSFTISKHLVMEAWMRIKSNGGSAGIDKQSISDFEKNLKDNLYRIWNRMSAGSYMPSPVKLVCKCWNQNWNLYSIMTLMDIVQGDLHMMHWIRLGSGAGNMIGYWIWISKGSLIT
jgi:retron-type reverse transcriptase